MCDNGKRTQNKTVSCGKLTNRNQSNRRQTEIKVIEDKTLRLATNDVRLHDHQLFDLVPSLNLILSIIKFNERKFFNGRKN
jgi:hypothetical protein